MPSSALPHHTHFWRTKRGIFGSIVSLGLGVLFYSWLTGMQRDRDTFFADYMGVPHQVEQAYHKQWDAFLASQTNSLEKMVVVGLRDTCGGGVSLEGSGPFLNRMIHVVDDKGRYRLATLEWKNYLYEKRRQETLSCFQHQKGSLVGQWNNEGTQLYLLLNEALAFFGPTA